MPLSLKDGDCIFVLHEDETLQGYRLVPVAPGLEPLGSNGATFGARLIYYRSRYDWSQTELSRRAGLSNGLVSLLEMNKKSPAGITVGTAKKIAGALGISLDLLFSDVGPLFTRRGPARRQRAIKSHVTPEG